MSTPTKPTNADELLALRLIAHRLVAGDAKTVQRLVPDLRVFHHLIPLADALERQVARLAHGGLSMTRDEVQQVIADAVVQTQQDSPISLKDIPAEDLAAIAAPLPNPAKAAQVLERLRAAKAKAEQVAAFQNAVEVAQQVTDGSPLEEGLREIRRSTANLRHHISTDPRALRQAQIDRDAMIAAGTAGFTLNQPYFSSEVADFIHGWLAAGRVKPAEKILFGGDSNAGKTSFANAFAVCALKSGIPVYYHQAELLLSDAMRQINCVADRIPRSKTATADDPWSDFLDKITFPDQNSKLESVDSLIDSVYRWVDEISVIRAGNASANPCTGLLILDYCQLMDDENSDKDGYQRSELIVSRLAQVAAKTGVAMLWLSQTTRGARAKLQAVLNNEKSDYAERVNALVEYANSAYAGGNLMRPADAAFCIATENIDGKMRRILTCGKSRGGEFSKSNDLVHRCIEVRYDEFGRVSGSGYAVGDHGSTSMARSRPDPAIAAVADLGVQIIANKNGKRK